MSALQRKVLKKGLPPLPPAGLPSHTSTKRPKRDYSPLPWSDFFTQSRDIQIGVNSFRVYEKGESGPLLLLLHGGGYSALSWAVFTEAILKLVNCRVAALDLRGHGHTVTDNDEDLSSETLINDVGNVVSVLFKDEAPPTVLMGHSMGGAIAVRVAAADLVPTLVGLAVIDVVEGTAVDSLGSMQSFLRGRPASFKSVEHAIEWSIRSGQLKNTLSARVSMPGQIKRMDQNTSLNVMTSKDTESHTHEQHQVAASRVPLSKQEEEEEEGEEDEHESKGEGKYLSENSVLDGSLNITSQSTTSTTTTSSSSSSSSSSSFMWRIDLTKTEPFWSGWFTGLSKLFTSSTSVPKMLILAGVDRLDKELTIAQMQGKFQMMVLSGCGHTVHEDVPDKVADIIAAFLLRQRLTTSKAEFKRPFPAC